MDAPSGAPAWPMPGDEAGETAAMFVARLVPEPGTDLGALAAVVQRFLDTHCNAPPPHGVGGYIWDREVPMLHADDDDDHVLLLDMRVQGCVDDEWFLVYLLRELSRTLALCISVEDEDGEFLLIEAADELPKWVRPDNAARRVWMAGGALHLIPPTSAPLDQPLSVTAATALVREDEQATRAPPKVEQAAFARLAAYPQAAIDHHHHTLAYLPSTAAKVLAAHPQWVSDAVHMLTSRDVVSARLTQPLTYFPVATDEAAVPAPELVRVRMTRHLYARLCMERFFPAKSFGRAWQRKVELYRLALRGQDASVSEHEQHHGRWFDMGAKLTSGLEMWVHHLHSQSVYTHSPDRSHSPEERARLVASLTRLGYFGSEIPGSAQWQALEAQALRIAAQQSSAGRAYETMPTLQRFQAALQAPADERVYTLSPDRDTATLRSHEDSDAWMSEAPEGVEALLSEHGADGAEDATVDRFQLFMNKMQTFIDSQGDMEGALFDDDDWDDSDSASEDDAREQRMQTLVDPVPAHEWGAKNAAMAHSGSAAPASARAVPESSPASVTESVARRAPQRLEGLTRLEPLEGDSDSDRESLQGDDDDAPEERAERHSMLGMHEPGPHADEAAAVGEDGPVEQDMDDFLAFTRRTLGLTDAQYADILQERRERGAYVPPTSGPVDTTGPPLERLDAVLDAMERELVKERHKSMDVDDEPELDDEDAELLQHLLASGMSLPDSLQRFAAEHNVHESEAAMLGDFLESFAAQGGRPGPVGTLSARLGVGALPRDAAP
ncbi:hypothetical protein MCAP1_003537 [Malassezia caprae]|uniref:Uncharacterized protein n=1 Tax=Malassezia caprae TaxID=1381934 RepID=A0AAF0IX19_9BASI|nr:hypothetical protein MCAP1_003537 [Malassezia caprae]